MTGTQDRRMALRREVHGKRDHRLVAAVAALCTMLGVGVGFGLSQLEVPGCKRGPVVRHAVWAPIAVVRPDPPRIAWLGVLTSSGDGDGVEIEFVAPNTPAQRAGLAPDDAVIAIDGELVDHPAELVREVRRRSPGQAVELVVERGDGDVERMQVTLGSRGARPHPAPRFHRSWR